MENYELRDLELGDCVCCITPFLIDKIRHYPTSDLLTPLTVFI